MSKDKEMVRIIWGFITLIISICVFIFIGSEININTIQGTGIIIIDYILVIITRLFFTFCAFCILNGFFIDEI